MANKIDFVRYKYLDNMSAYTITVIYGMKSRDFSDADKASRFVRKLDEKYKVIVFAEGETTVFKSVKKAKRFIEEELEYSSDSSSSDEESSDEEEAPRPKKAPAKKNTKKITELPKAVFGRDPFKAYSAALKTKAVLGKNQGKFKLQCDLAEARCESYVSHNVEYEPVPKKENNAWYGKQVEISKALGMCSRVKANGHAGFCKR
mgnify:CR=1 FL=1